MPEFNELAYKADYWIFLLPMVGVCGDIVTGWIQASVNGSWDSTKMRRGLYRKLGELLAIALTWVVGQALVLPVNLAGFVSGYIVIMEFLSVIENLDHAGVPIPHAIVKFLKKAKETIDGDESNT